MIDTNADGALLKDELHAYLNLDGGDLVHQDVVKELHELIHKSHPVIQKPQPRKKKNFPKPRPSVDGNGESEPESEEHAARLGSAGESLDDADNPVAALTAEMDLLSDSMTGEEKAELERELAVLGNDQEGMRIEVELGLTGSEEEAAQIAKMQATVRGKQDRKKVR